MEQIKRADMAAFFRAAAQRMQDEADALCRMDALLGDGDLGLTMKKAFGALPAVADETEEADLGRLIVKAALKMASAAPSTMGFLMSSGLMSAGKALLGAEQIDAPAYARFLSGYAAGIAQRGRCARGERTVLDAFAPAAERAEALLSAAPRSTLAEVARAAEEAAAAGVEATKAMRPKYGKAAVHQEAALGVADQGACVALYLLEAWRRFIEAGGGAD